MSHLIFGGGNLGLDLQRELLARGETVDLRTHSSGGFDVTDREAVMRILDQGGHETIWYCVGAGSVAEALADPGTANQLHVEIPSMIANNRPAGSRFVAFSSDYAADEQFPNYASKTGKPRSLYAEMKQTLEWAMVGAGRHTACIRVGSLYGDHKPEKTFPGKILRKFGFDKNRIRLPLNMVTPTPTRWLAGQLCGNLDSMFSDRAAVIHHCAPKGSVSVRDWAIMILSGLRWYGSVVREPWYDEARPLVSALGCTVGENPHHWHYLWSQYFDRRVFTQKEMKHRLPKA
jgi:dTDP-4-dehydrorhamnose reductase